jgi:hypothetical protein
MSGAFAEGSAERYISAHVPRIRPYRVNLQPVPHLDAHADFHDACASLR